MRRMKERFEETSMMKQANTRAFSAQAGEYGDDAMGLTLGLLDTADLTGGGTNSHGPVRKNVGEKKKMKYANTRESRKRSAQLQAKANNVNASGLASSMVFTPVQGMELINPDANKERVRLANRKWFDENAGFQSSQPK